MLAITSQHRLGIVYPSPPSTFQGQDQLDLFRPAVKWGGPVFEWARIPEVLRLAFREMHNGRPGPVHVELPAPILYETGDPRTAPVWPHTAYRVGPPQPSERQLDEAAALLGAAERPVVIAGSGVDRGGARAAVLEIAELLGCPAISSMAGRASVPADHPNYVFGFGPAGDLARREADVLLVVGSRMGNLDVPYDTYWGDPEGKRLIQIDIDPRHFGVTRPLHLGILADARAALDGIAARLRTTDLGTRDGADLARYRQLDEQVRMQIAAPIMQWQGPGIHPAHALGAIGAVFEPDAVYTVDGGNTSLWAYNVLPPTQPGSYHSILELGMLGTGIPSAIGAKLGAPDREVVCVTGDGAAGFNIMELRPPRARASTSPSSCSRRAPGPWRNSTSDSSTALPSAPPRVRSAGTSSPRGWAATASTWNASRTSTARCARASTAAPAWSACAPTTTPTSPYPPTWWPASSRSTPDRRSRPPCRGSRRIAMAQNIDLPTITGVGSTRGAAR